MDFMVKIPKRKPNIEIQIQAMKAKFPKFKYKKLGQNKVLFNGFLQAKLEMPKYQVSLLYNGNCRPEVKVISPKLKENAPHVFDSGNLCLYHSKNYHWSCNKLIAKQIMQWTIAWLYFYEIWKDCGIWYGPEVEHNIKKIEANGE